MRIDLRSDTVTRPTPGMKEAMFSAQVGDDVFEEDPTVQELEQKAAAIFGKEAGLFCPSGTMTNQIAIRLHTDVGGEVICDRLSHVYNYEGGGIAVNTRASVRLVEGDHGRFTAQDVVQNINPDDIHFPVTQLVVAEDTCNRGGGCYYDFDALRGISAAAKSNKLGMHLDGARVFNALVETGYDPKAYGALFDSISVCLSKGLGAPIGSVLLGSSHFVHRARRVRKVLGGGMRQVGFLAAAGIYALEHQVDRLAEDHLRAKQLSQIIQKQAFTKELIPVHTNIVVFVLQDAIDQQRFIHTLQSHNILVVPFGPQRIRMVLHHDVSDAMLEQLEATLTNLSLN